MAPASTLPVGILFPMEFEAEPTWKKLGGKSRPAAELETLKGSWNGLAVVSARIGMGNAGLDRKVEAWLAEHPCRAVILAGLAGALDPDWDEGDLSSFHAEAWPEVFVWARSKPAVRAGKWHTAHEIIETGLAKLELGRKTGCGLVEMEWEYVAEACRRRDVPLVGLRAVSDHADKLLPADLFLLGCDAVTGKSTPVKIGLYLALRPWRLRELIPAVGGCIHAREVMSKALGDFLEWIAEKGA